MQRIKFSKWCGNILICSAFIFTSISQGVAQTGVPALSTGKTISGLVGRNFVIVLPLSNVGTDTAGAAEITSVTFAGAALNRPTLPLPAESIAPSEFRMLVLQFDSKNLATGGTYLLTVRGTYKLGTETLGFAINRFFTATVPSASLQGELQQWVTLDAVAAKDDSLPGADVDADNQEMLSFFQSRPEFVASGIDIPSATVWAQLANGQYVVIMNDRDMSPTLTSGTESLPAVSPTVSSKASLAPNPQQKAVVGTIDTELPASSTYRVLNTFGYGVNSADGDIYKWLDLHNYIAAQTNTIASVANLKTVGGEGGFYFSTHGGLIGKAPNQFFGLWTSEEPSLDEYEELLNAGDFAQPDPSKPPRVDPWVRAKQGYDMFTGKIRKEYHCAITSEFVRKYWSKFGLNSLIYIDACSSNASAAQNFAKACFDAQASVYVGWAAPDASLGSTVGSSVAADTARFIFDRLLGVDQYEAIKPPERPFDFLSVLSVLSNHHGEKKQYPDGLGVYKKYKNGNLVNDASLTYNSNPEPSLAGFGLLAPSILNMQVDESALDNLTIFGLFGSNPESDGSTTVGGVSTPIVSTTPPFFIKTDLAPSGPGSAGDVVVEIHHHKSNVARLTQWQGTFDFKAKGTQSLNQHIIYNPSFRADIRQIHPVIDGPLVEPDSFAEPTLGLVNPVSTAKFSSGGEAVVMPDPNEIDTYKWTGSGDMVAVIVPIPPPVPDNWFTMLGHFANSHTQMNMDLSESLFAGTENVHRHIIDPPTDIDNLPEILVFCPSDLSVTVNLDDKATILGAPVPVSIDAGPCLGPGPVQSVLQWSNIPATPGTAPDPNSAR